MSYGHDCQIASSQCIIWEFLLNILASGHCRIVEALPLSGHRIHKAFHTDMTLVFVGLMSRCLKLPLGEITNPGPSAVNATPCGKRIRSIITVGFDEPGAKCITIWPRTHKGSNVKQLPRLCEVHQVGAETRMSMAMLNASLNGPTLGKHKTYNSGMQVPTTQKAHNTLHLEY